MSSSVSLALPRLRVDQYEIAKHPARKKFLAMGRRWGKSVLGGALVLNVLRQHGKAAWLVPTYKNARPLWRYVKNVCAPLEAQRVVDVSKSERTVTTFRDGFLGIFSADNIDAMRGESFDLVVIDEAARVDGEQKQDVVDATLADRNGAEIDISSPKGRNTFFLEFLAAQQDTSGDSAAWHAPTNANPLANIQNAFQRAQAQLPARTFRQEWLAEFIDGGAFFSNVIACATATEQNAAIEKHEYVIGVDWARAAGGDNTWFLVLDATTQGVAHLTRLNGRAFDYQLAVLKNIWERFNSGAIVAEYNSLGMKPVEDLQSAGLPVMPFTTTAASKHEIMTALALAFEKKDIAILNDTTLVGELQAFETHARAGLPSYGAPDGMHDDGVMALALAWHGVNRRVGVLFEV